VKPVIGAGAGAGAWPWAHALLDKATSINGMTVTAILFIGFLPSFLSGRSLKLAALA
jgi:hypothetical protein